MRTTRDLSEVPVSSRFLYLVAAACFGPLALILLLGLLAVPVWVEMIAMHLAEPQRFTHEASGTIWDGIWPLMVVMSGFVGIVGLFRALALRRRGATALSRRLTVAMVLVGLTALAAFDVIVIAPGILSEPTEDLPIAGLAMYVVLPFGGAAWILFVLRDVLFTGLRA